MTLSAERFSVAVVSTVACHTYRSSPRSEKSPLRDSGWIASAPTSSWYLSTARRCIRSLSTARCWLFAKAAKPPKTATIPTPKRATETMASIIEKPRRLIARALFKLACLPCLFFRRGQSSVEELISCVLIHEDRAVVKFDAATVRVPVGGKAQPEARRRRALER